jgi:Tautomerase enzyme
MPLVRIDVLQGYSREERKATGDCVQRAMVETLGVPERDRFQVITEHLPENSTSTGRISTSPVRTVSSSSRYVVLPRERWR